MPERYNPAIRGSESVTLSSAQELRDRQQQAAQREKTQRTLDQIKKEAREEYAVHRPEPIRNAIFKEELCLGMDEKDVLVCLGRPEKKTRMIHKDGTRETWIYGKLLVWFDEGIVTGWRLEQ